MKIPPRIKIGDCYYKIIYKKSLQDRKKRELYGEIKYDEKKIYLNLKYSHHFKNTFLHEIIHGITDFMKIGITEKTVTQLTNGLMCVFVDNKLTFS